MSQSWLLLFGLKWLHAEIKHDSPLAIELTVHSLFIFHSGFWGVGGGRKEKERQIENLFHCVVAGRPSFVDNLDDCCEHDLLS